MSASDKISGLLRTKKENFKTFSSMMNVTPQATSKKAKNQTWNINDLINIAKITGSKLSFIDSETEKPLVIFEENDIKKGNP